jgi:hypothetical protein
MHVRAAAALALTAAALSAAPARADVEDELRARLRGRVALLRVAVASECTEHYSDNAVTGAHASGRGPYRLPAGELATIDNVHVGWTTGLTVNLSLQVPYRAEIVDGPFTLYEHRACRVQLAFDVPREVRKDAARAERTLLEVLELQDSASAARRSELWNGREPEPLPADAEATWAEYRTWKAAQVNAAVREQVDDVLAGAQTALARFDDDPEYRESFALGVESKRYWAPSSCEEALSASFYPAGSGGESARGYADGQHLVWALAVARTLQDCFVDVESGR